MTRTADVDEFVEHGGAVWPAGHDPQPLVVADAVVVVLEVDDLLDVEPNVEMTPDPGRLTGVCPALEDQPSAPLLSTDTDVQRRFSDR